MYDLVICNAHLIQPGKIIQADLAVSDGRIERIEGTIQQAAKRVIDAQGLYLMPGVIDDQVHFREPGLTYKADLLSESLAALAGGVTSFMEMPNTKPPATTQALLAEKYVLAAQKSWVNYSFYMGTTNDNFEEVMRTNPHDVCGVKVFMGSSTGNMLVDDVDTLTKLFKEWPHLIATHCEDEETIKHNLAQWIGKYGDDIPAHAHPLIRSHEACYLSSSLAVDLARKYGTRLHVLHLTTGKETELFDAHIPLADKRITSEVCVHHLCFDDRDYTHLGHQIKCNPAIKTPEDQNQLWSALLSHRIDVIATDHAPHTWSEKNQPYTSAPSGLPLIQHPLNLMLDAVHQNKLSLSQLVDFMCHRPAIAFNIEGRGFLQEGFWADMVLIDPHQSTIIEKQSLLYKCGWSPLMGRTLRGKIVSTFINGVLAFAGGQLLSKHPAGQRLHFNNRV